MRAEFEGNKAGAKTSPAVSRPRGSSKMQGFILRKRPGWYTHFFFLIIERRSNLIEVKRRTRENIYGL